MIFLSKYLIISRTTGWHMNPYTSEINSGWETLKNYDTYPQLPFSDFQREVLRWTKLSPSQIHPNSYAFMRAFELVCQHLGGSLFQKCLLYHLHRSAGGRLGFFPSNQEDVWNLCGESTEFQIAFLFGKAKEWGCFEYSLGCGKKRSPSSPISLVLE